MNAFTQIIAQLIASVPEVSWHELRFFPFKDLPNAQGVMEDVCVFRQSAQGALGFVWIAFDSKTKLFCLAFRLARYSEDGDLITLPPWSLREASADPELYVAWREALRIRSPLVTYRGARLQQRFCKGQAAIVALSLSREGTNACVRVERQEAYKIFFVQDLENPMNLEVDMLEYLTNSSSFTQFSRLISVYDYCRADDFQPQAVAFNMEYIQNHGTLEKELLSRIERFFLAKPLQERARREGWADIITQCEQLGRLVGEFHRAMLFSREKMSLRPEPNTAESSDVWVRGLARCLRELWEGLLSRLRDAAVEKESVLEKMKGTIETTFAQWNLLSSSPSQYPLQYQSQLGGVRICLHGHLHLGQILVGAEGLFLINFGREKNCRSLPESSKQPCLVEVAECLVSLRRIWLFARHRTRLPLFSREEPLAGVGDGEVPGGTDFHPTELEATFLRFYLSVVEEDASSAELVPRQREDRESLLRVCFLRSVMVDFMESLEAGKIADATLNQQILFDFLYSKSAFKFFE